MTNIANFKTILNVMLSKSSILIPQDKIAERIESLAKELSSWIGENDSDTIIIWIAEGAMLFASDLVKKLGKPNILIHSIRVSSYLNSTTPEQEPKICGDLPDVNGMRVLVVDDILDTGATLKKLYAELEKQSAKEVKICVLLNKNIPSPKIATADFVGFEVGNAFLFGYGLDFHNKYRSLPDIWKVNI